MDAVPPAARGRHAPPPEIRIPLQRERLLRAAAAEFAERGYAGASSESISRRAGMSKATFYEHFDNKEDCIIGLFEHAADVLTVILWVRDQCSPESSHDSSLI